MAGARREESQDLGLSQRITQSMRQKEMHLRAEGAGMQGYVQVPTSPPGSANVRVKCVHCRQVQSSY